MTRYYRLLVFAISLLVLPELLIAQERMLEGRVLLVGQHGETTPAVGVDVSLAGRDTARTKARGYFKLFLPALFKPGETVTLTVTKPGWKIQYPLDGEVRIPAEPHKDPITIRMLATGSRKFWTDDRIEKFIADTAERAKQQVEPGGKPENIDFSRYIKEWATRYGFSVAEAKAEIDQWVAEVQRNQDDIYRLGLAAYAEKNFGKASELFAEAADLKVKRRAAVRRQRDELARKETLLTEEIVRDRRLAGDAAYNNYAFHKALAHYQQARTEITRDERPQLWASLMNDIGKAHYQIGIRVAGSAIQEHLSAARKAYRAALEVYTRELLPQDWAMTQNNLGSALQEQGIRTGGEDGRRLLAQAVSAYRAALEVRTLEHLPMDWAQTQNNLAKAYLALDDATNAAASFTNVLFVYPDYREAYEIAHFLYHEQLFEFAKAFALNQQWLERHPEDLYAQVNFAEAHFTTAQFAEAKSRLATLMAKPELDPGNLIALRTLELATLLALGEADTISQKIDALHQFVTTQSAEITSTWTFTGSKHFVKHHKRLASYPWLYDVFTAIEAQDWKTLLATLQTAKSTFHNAERQALK